MNVAVLILNYFPTKYRIEFGDAFRELSLSVTLRSFGYRIYFAFALAQYINIYCYLVSFSVLLYISISNLYT